MKRNNSKFYYTLIATLCVVPSVSYSAVRVTNISRNNKSAGYQQVNAARYPDTSAVQSVSSGVSAAAATPNGVVSTTPVVPNVSNTPADLTSMERCESIYPNGEFAWAYPTAGRGIGGAPTCTAVVKLLALGAADNGGDVVVATVNLAAGDSMRCNIEDFPESTHSNINLEISVPADNEPTMDDVIKTMNQEQKQNAAIKIVSTAVVGALGGNIAGDNAPGSDSMLGGGKDKIQSTVIGALGGAALGVGNVYGGKVAGDMILSAGVNAAAGSVVGNIAASGNSVLRIENCATADGTETTCLWGKYEKTEPLTDKKTYVNKTKSSFMVCDKDSKNCESANLTNVKIANYNPTTKNGKTITPTFEDMVRESFGGYDGTVYTLKDSIMSAGSQNDEELWIPIDSASKVIESTPALIVEVHDKSFGWKTSDWGELKKQLGSSRPVYRRTGNGVVGSVIEGATIDDFKPLDLSASDGDMIDLDSKARLKGTLTGAGVGGAMGAFTAYQGAQSEIEQRWVAAVREYKDSLQKVVCMTGNRFLSQYNDTVAIPPMPEPVVSE